MCANINTYLKKIKLEIGFCNLENDHRRLSVYRFGLLLRIFIARITSIYFCDSFCLSVSNEFWFCLLSLYSCRRLAFMAYNLCERGVCVFWGDNSLVYDGRLMEETVDYRLDFYSYFYKFISSYVTSCFIGPTFMVRPN